MKAQRSPCTAAARHHATTPMLLRERGAQNSGLACNAALFGTCTGNIVTKLCWSGVDRPLCYSCACGHTGVGGWRMGWDGSVSTTGMTDPEAPVLRDLLAGLSGGRRLPRVGLGATGHHGPRRSESRHTLHACCTLLATQFGGASMTAGPGPCSSIQCDGLPTWRAIATAVPSDTLKVWRGIFADFAGFPILVVARECTCCVLRHDLLTGNGLVLCIGSVVLCCSACGCGDSICPNPFCGCTIMIPCHQVG